MQVPAPFQYQKAASVEHALTLLAQYGTESMVVAGGHSLLPMMKLRLAHPEALIDINGLDLADIRLADSRLHIGALVRHAALLSSPLAGTYLPILHDAERVIADPIVRNRGTVGGSLCQADPSEDLSAAFAALRASLIAVGPSGTRTIPARDFFTGPYETALDHGELLTEIQAPIGKASAYVKVERRAGDWAIGAACAVLTISPDGIVTEAGIGLAALGAARFVAAEAEDFLCGGPATDDRFIQAGRIAAEHCNPSADQRGPVVYKRHLAGELTTRALRLAASRAA